MNYLAIDKHPWSISFALFKLETKELLRYGKIQFVSLDEQSRQHEMWEKIENLIQETEPSVVITPIIDFRHTLKVNVERIASIKTIIRKVCLDKNILYQEFRTMGWEMRITNMQKPSPKAKLAIAREYDLKIDSVEIANAIILGEGVVWNRLQIGRS